MYRIFLLSLVSLFLQSPIVIAQIKGYKYNTVKLVLDKVAAAYGSNINPPKLEVLGYKSNRKVAVMYYPGDRPLIVMDEEVYDLCVGFGKDSLNALASLLGHELAHHYKKHDWCSNFAFLMGNKDDLAIRLKKESKESKELVESQADYWGGFYGYVAGFSTYEITPKLLDALYSKYKCPERIPGYPTKTERKIIAEKRKGELQNWIAIFDVSEYLFIQKEYQKVSVCLDFLSEKFPSRELFCNSGVCKLLMAMDYFDAKEIPFILPLEYDTKTRLKNSSVRSLGVDPQEKLRLRNLWLDEAINLFDKASQADPEYFNAKINKAVAYTLKGNGEMALGIVADIVNSEKKTDDKNVLAKAYTIKGIVLNRNEKLEDSKINFETANSLYTSSMTNYNLGVAKELDKGLWDSFTDYVNSFFEKEEANETNPEKNFNPAKEEINGVNTFGITPSENWKTVNVIGNSLIKIQFNSSEREAQFVISQRNEVKRFIATKLGYISKSAQGIGIGDSAELVKQKYGSPTNKISVVKGEYWIFKKSRIAFLINENGKVEKWIIFSK